jgi:FtsZ-binding cell division protein ZapB
MIKTDVATIIENFQPLTKFIGTPNYQTIAAKHKILKQNASSVTTTLAGGQHGLLAIITTNEEYNTLTNEVWIEPQHPGPRPVLERDTKRNVVSNVINKWEDEMDTWSLVQYIRKALTKQIINAIDDEYIEDLKDPNTGYANVTPIEMIEHLYSEYGQLTNQDIIENRNRLKQDFDTSKSMVAHFQNIREIRLVAEKAKQPIADADTITETYLVLDRCGLFPKAIDEWDDAEPAEQTWHNFQKHFKKAYRRYKDKQKRNNVNNTSTMEHALAAKSHTTNKWETVMQQNTKLIAANMELTKQVKQCMDDIQKLQKDMENIKKGQRNTNRSQRQQQDRLEVSPNPQRWKQYCWSCGLTNDRNHNSMNCPNPKPGHKQWATYKRKFGGSENGCE